MKESFDQAVLYSLKAHSDIEPAEMIAIIYLADVYHLLLFGRTITNSIKDTKYYLMDIEDMKKLMEKVKDKVVTCEFEYLSESDRKALGFAYSRFELQKDGFGEFPLWTGF